MELSSDSGMDDIFLLFPHGYFFSAFFFLFFLIISPTMFQVVVALLICFEAMLSVRHIYSS